MMKLLVLCMIALSVSNLSMPTYTVKAINVGSFDLGEADRVLTIFSAEKGLLKAVAKGARKPGTKMAGRSDALCVNEYLLAKGKTFEIITQAQTIESFSKLRSNLALLSYGLYYAELTACFGQGLEEDSSTYFDFLIKSLNELAACASDPLPACMKFELSLLDFLGYKPELTFCIICREALTEYNLSRFNIEFGGIVCSACNHKARRLAVREAADNDENRPDVDRGVHITPLVWKTLVLRSEQSDQSSKARNPIAQVQEACQRLLQAYIEERAGKHFKSLDLLKQI